MRAVLCTEFGPPEKLVIADIPVPNPSRGQVRIKVEACGVNFPDTLIIENRYQYKPNLPFSPGGEVAGIIDALGDGVDDFSVGESVMAMTLFGGFSEYIVIDSKALLRRPSEMDGATAAGFTMTYGTSMYALKQRGQVKEGEKLLVLGAGGGVGITAVEIGKLMGAEVIAAASNEKKLEAAKKAGAHHLINYGKNDLRDEIKSLVGINGIDVLYDPVGGDLFEPCVRSMSWGGRALVIGFASGNIPKLPTNLTLLKGCSVVGVFWGNFRLKETATDNENFKTLFRWYQEKKLSPLVSQQFPLENVAEALLTLANRKAIGKIILKP